ncbi:MAG: 4Fe-4S binding protein [Thermodesulfobacteriota bacterium]
MENVYKKLAIHLNNTPSGFPETDSGVELKLLSLLFTPQEADLALYLVERPESVEAIAKRANKNLDEIEPALIEMGQKGLLLHIKKKEANAFMLLQFVVGIWEHQVNRLTKELIETFNEYAPFLIKNQYRNKTQQFRVIPVGKAVNTELNIMDYEQVEKIIRSQSKILVAPCICRKEHEIMGKGCGRLMEACLIFGSGAYIYENRGVGREISHEEALDIVKEAEKQGLVPQPSNAKKPVNICLCCDCCCQILKNIKDFKTPARIVHSNFQAFIDQDECTGCGACEEICPMDAIEMNEEDSVAKVDLDRCIGCGLCVTACAFDAIVLADKKETEKIEPPAKLIETFEKITREKGLDSA